jgi:hypothetical protein
MQIAIRQPLALNCNRILLACAIVLLLLGSVHAADIDGAWANDLSVCSKIFVKKNSGVSMAGNADFFGSGFIIDGKEIKGKMATCHIKTRKQDGPVVQLLTDCSTDIAVSTNQFSLRMDGKNKMTRFFPGMPGIEMTYFRCRQ